MKKLIVILEQIPQWYGCGIILLYSLLLAEFLSALHDLTPYNNDLGGFLDVYYKINYISTIVSSIIIWIIMSLLFHLTTLLFNGCALFARFFYISSYFYLIPTTFIIIAIIVIGQIDISSSDLTVLQNHPSFKLAMILVNYSYIPYYLLCMILIHHLYKVRLRYAIASVVIPILSVWAITKLFTLL